MAIIPILLETLIVYICVLNCPILRANTDKLEANEPC